MVFSSPGFLFLFFPCFYALYFLLPKTWRNGFILLASLGFYLLGAGALTIVALVLLVVNYLLAGAIGKLRRHEAASPRSRSSSTSSGANWSAATCSGDSTCSSSAWRRNC
ncbi:MAG: hypothetical protein ABIQ08_17495 [Duganella sp.]